MIHQEEEEGNMVSSPPSHGSVEKKRWWLTNKKIVDMYVKDARSLIGTGEDSNIADAVNLLDAALAISPRSEMALELKATSLLHLRRFKEVADMLQDYIPSLTLKMTSSEDSYVSSSSSSSSSDTNSETLSRERLKLLSAGGGDSHDQSSFKCLSVYDLKKKLMAGHRKNRDKQGQWRYLVLGQACCHLGLMEDAMALLQTGKRIASAAFRRESVYWSDDSFSSSAVATLRAESESICQLVSHMKLLLRRKTAAIAAAEAGLYSEAIRHFSKIVEGRRGAPQGFLAECLMRRASACKASGRVAEAIADCNRTLALDPCCIEALSSRASLFEGIRCLPESLHDLEHLKLLYNSILRDRKLPGPAWKPQKVGYGEIPGKLCSIAVKIQQQKQRVGSGEVGGNVVDFYALMGLPRGCSRSELETAHLLLTLRHKPDKSTAFIERCQFADEAEIDSIRDRAKMSALLLFRLIQRAYTSLMRVVVLDEAAAAQQQRKKQPPNIIDDLQQQPNKRNHVHKLGNKQNANANAFQGVFCRDLAVVGNLLSQAGFNRPIPVKYEALSC